MALSKNNRIGRFKSDYFANGKKFFGQYFTVINKFDSDPTYPRFAILVSKKTAKKAVDRNKIRRLTLAVIQKRMSSFATHDYLLIPKSSLLIATFENLTSDITNVARKIQ